MNRILILFVLILSKSLRSKAYCLWLAYCCPPPEPCPQVPDIFLEALFLFTPGLTEVVGFLATLLYPIIVISGKVDSVPCLFI
mgnify:CR=1 FL=1